jgi:hypothetical protein
MFDMNVRGKKNFQIKCFYIIEKFSKSKYLEWSYILIWDCEREFMMKRKVEGHNLPSPWGESGSDVQNPFFLFIVI